MTKRKEHTWVPNNKASGVPMMTTGALPHMPATLPTTTEHVALATRCVNRHATDARDAARLLVTLGIGAAR